MQTPASCQGHGGDMAWGEPHTRGTARQTASLCPMAMIWRGARADPQVTALPKLAPCSGGSIEAEGPRHPPTSLSPAPRPAGPPRLCLAGGAAAAGLGPLTGYCSRIYCIAARAGCSPAHNRFAVAQGSTLRGKERKVGFRQLQICRAFAAVYCRILPPTLGPPVAPRQPCHRGFQGVQASPPHPHTPILWCGCLLRLQVPMQAGGHPTCLPSPFWGGSKGAVVPNDTWVLWGHPPGPPSPGAPAQSWCREEAGDCKQH